jgi:signal recognition particle subunit SRP72
MLVSEGQTALALKTMEELHRQVPQNKALAAQLLRMLAV